MKEKRPGRPGATFNPVDPLPTPEQMCSDGALSVSRAARFCGISTDAMRACIQKRIIASFRVGGARVALDTLSYERARILDGHLVAASPMLRELEATEFPKHFQASSTISSRNGGSWKQPISLVRALREFAFLPSLRC